ncbi:hypothetical protein E1212_16555 [Jiangella ureilytica]|uniref:Uncharacterized protein n=1 Tax=Jiangella ureilytica TaxID=2530374 RepID=A0A4R4RMZ7_9ACTN|nr:hypothetical protein E1212_16555 [Jiangella ureilytica]
MPPVGLAGPQVVQALELVVAPAVVGHERAGRGLGVVDGPLQGPGGLLGRLPAGGLRGGGRFGLGLGLRLGFRLGLGRGLFGLHLGLGGSGEVAFERRLLRGLGLGADLRECQLLMPFGAQRGGRGAGGIDEPPREEGGEDGDRCEDAESDGDPAQTPASSMHEGAYLPVGPQHLAMES